VPVLWTELDVYHDLASNRYYVAFLDNEESEVLSFREENPPDSLFNPNDLRRRGK
jgi:hypothetical protein